jgi:hypothetical protein
MKTRVLLGVVLAGGALAVSSASTPHPPGSTLPLVAELFRTSDRCVGCHSGVTAPSGEDVSIGYDWRASMMANSARDPYWQASVRREVTDHAADGEAIQDECAKCHMPMARATAAAEGARARVFDYLAAAGDDEQSALALDGVSCSLCHQIQADGLGTEASFSGGFRVDTETAWGERSAFGPFDPDDGRLSVMHSATGLRQTRADHLAGSELCASCHTLSTHALGAGAGASLPEQMPYLEWRASSFEGERTCQSCHMPEVSDEVRVSSVLGDARTQVSRHTFLGGNFFMLRMLARYRRELGVKALPQELENAAARTLAQLEGGSTARVAVDGAAVANGRLELDVVVTNLAGHKLPTGYPSRRVWLDLAVRDAAGRVLFESGALQPDGSIAGNDNDADALRFEPHYSLIQRPEQVQVYESMMADPQGRPTTGLLTAVRFAKDNRLLPDGFDRSAAGASAGVVGAEQDGDFTGGGDRVRYEVPLGPGAGPYAVEVRLWYQPIGFRWAQNLAAYDAEETRRFSEWYRAMAGGSAVVLARVETRVGGGE